MFDFSFARETWTVSVPLLRGGWVAAGNNGTGGSYLDQKVLFMPDYVD